jgi:hypothetical protein
MNLREAAKRITPLVAVQMACVIAPKSCSATLRGLRGAVERMLREEGERMMEERRRKELAEIFAAEIREMNRAFLGASEVAWGAGASLATLSSTLQRAAEREYLKHYSRLPGSTRTARLRKKRRDTVMRAFWNGA